jgi:hypothetical protein
MASNADIRARFARFMETQEKPAKDDADEATAGDAEPDDGDADEKAA